MSTEAIPDAGIAVVGRGEVVTPFKGAGLAVFPVEPGPRAATQVQKLVDDGYRIVFFTEDLFPHLGALLERSRRCAVPCLVALPLGAGRQGIARLKEIVKRAVGADIFGDEPRGDGK